MVGLLRLPEFVEKANRWLSNLSAIEPVAQQIKPMLTQLQSSMQESALTKIHDVMKETIKSARAQEVKEYLQVLILQQIQKWLGKISYAFVDPRQFDMIKAVDRLRDPNLPDRDRMQILRDGLTKGAPTSQITPSTSRVFRALDSAILKLAGMSLSLQPDYGTTGDMAERLKKIKETLKEPSTDAAMLKIIPPMQDYDESPQQVTPETPSIADYDEGPQPEAESPKIIVIKDYDETETPDQTIVKEGPPCCESCGQEIPAIMGREAHCMDSKFKKIRDTLRKSGLKEPQLKTIYSALDKIYDKYRELEEKD
jgi:hypothetical protein